MIAASNYPNWADEPPIWAKVNALGGTFDPGNPYDAGYDAALRDALALIEVDVLTNAARDLLAAAQRACVPARPSLVGWVQVPAPAFDELLRAIVKATGSQVSA